MDAERIVVVAVVVVVGIILAATCDYLLCVLLYRERNDKLQALGKKFEDEIRREIEREIRESEDKLNEISRAIDKLLSYGTGKNKNLSTYQKIKLS